MKNDAQRSRDPAKDNSWSTGGGSKKNKGGGTRSECRESTPNDSQRSTDFTKKSRDDRERRVIAFKKNLNGRDPNDTRDPGVASNNFIEPTLKQL